MHILKILLIPLLVIGLCSGCLPFIKKPAPSDVDTPVESERVMPSGNPAADRASASEYVHQALSLLQSGQEQEAKDLLETALRFNPQNKTATTLLDQVNSDPVLEFGEDYFIYTVRPGDSLSILAQRFFGNSLRFYTLVKYNDIEVPNRLHVGQEIKIPNSLAMHSREQEAEPAGQTPLMEPTGSEVVEPGGAAPAPPVVQRREPGPIPKKNALIEAQEHITAGRHQQAIRLLESNADATADPDRRKNLLLLAYERSITQLLAQGELTEAKQQLTGVTALHYESKEYTQRFNSLQKKLADGFYERGLGSLAQENHEQAYSNFTQALQLDPGLRKAAEQATQTKAALVADYHKRAMSAYRRHKLNEAIELWSKLLVLDPDHELAQLYRARAMELQEKLKELR